MSYTVLHDKLFETDGVCVLPIAARNGDRFQYLFDADLRAFVEAHTWRHGEGGVFTIIGGSTLYLHRHAMGVEGRKHVVKFRNGDYMDARRCNLAIVPASKHTKVFPVWFNQHGKPSGIFRYRITGNWYWMAQVNGKKKFFSIAKLGEFEAARRACAWRVEHMRDDLGLCMDEPTLQEFPTALDESGVVVPFYGPRPLAV